MYKALVTGAAGFIGGHLTQALLKEGWTVFGVDDLSSGMQSTLDMHIERGNFSPVYLDIADPNSFFRLEAVFRDFSPDYVFHLAAIPGVVQSVHDPVRSNYANVTGTLNLLELSRRYASKRFIFSSSSSVYGDNARIPTKECSPLSPKSPYALQKKMGEEYCSLFSDTYNLETVSLRYFNVFGPRQRADSAYAAVISAFCDCLSSGREPIIYGDGEQSRDFCYIDNVVAANILAATSVEKFSGEVFNIGCGGRTTVIELCTLLGTKDPIFSEAREGDVSHSQADISKARGVLGYEPKTSLEQGLSMTRDWYLEQRSVNSQE